MIKSIRFENFFSFKNVTIDLHQNINVLVGINGSGKSNLLKAIQLLKEGIAGNLKKLIIDEWGGFDQMCFADGKGKDIIIAYVFQMDISNIIIDFFYTITIKRLSSVEYALDEKLNVRKILDGNMRINVDAIHDGVISNINVQGEGISLEITSSDIKKSAQENIPLTHNELVLSHVNSDYSVLYMLKQRLSSFQIYDYFDTRPDSKMRGPVRSPMEKVLLPDGSNLPQLLHTFQISDKQRYEQIIQALAHVNPWYKNINFEFYASGTMALMLEEKTLNRAVAAAHVSDGTLRFLCLLAIVCNPNRGSIVCIDEPETGLHPDMLRTISELLKEASHTTQFIIATHSETMLNMFDFEHLRVLEKNENNETIAKQFSEKNFEGWYEEFSLGTMWRNGDFGGNRW